MNPRIKTAAIVISASALVGTAVHEVFMKDAYRDSGGVWTLGYGFTAGVKPGQTITPEKALVRLYQEIEGVYGAGVKKCVTAPLHQYEYDALVDAAYNAGVGAVCGELAPLFNNAKTDADYSKACARIETWRATVNGRDCRVRANNCYGLVVRRAKERAVCEGKT